MKKYKRIKAGERLKMIQPVLANKKSSLQVAKEVERSTRVIDEWVFKYKTYGIAGLENSKKCKKYSAAFKIKAIEEVLIKGNSKLSVCKKYEISSVSVLARWIKCYNGGKELKATSSRKAGTTMTTKRCKTTFEERIETTQFCIARHKDYDATMKKYNVSYQQIYSWVRKFEKLGIEGLQDRRGKSKEVDQLSELELLKLENKNLKERNEFLEMQDAFEKKLRELEHRYGRFR